MKKMIKRAILAMSLFTASVGTACADEGMWTLYNLPEAVYKQMQAEGFTMPYGGLYSDNNAIKNCVVNFSGYCSGVVVSGDGLVFTNHHCGFEAIRSHSTVEHDYMLNGFYAKTLKEELPNDNMYVAFMRSQQDITDRMEALGIHDMLSSQQEGIIDSIQTLLNDSVKAIDSTLYVEIDPFYEGNRYYATTYQAYTDLRLVFTVPKSMGKFGGETDNWMWPRQTCDFSVFRVYADKDGRPAPYSENNVPYHPESWAPVSVDGYKQGDFSMTIGYPGSTERYLSSYGIQEMRDCENYPRQQVRGIKQEIMERHMKASEAVRIKYDSKFAQSANYWKNAIGMNKCIDSIGIVKQKKEYEEKIDKWLKETTLTGSDTVLKALNLDTLRYMYSSQEEASRTTTYFVETFYNTNQLTSRALQYALGGATLLGDEDKPDDQYISFADNSDNFDMQCDKEILVSLLRNYRQHVSAIYLPAFYSTIDKKFDGDYQAFVNYVWDKSVLMKSCHKIYVNKKKVMNDPGVQIAMDLLDIQLSLRMELSRYSDDIEKQERLLCLAKTRMEQDMPHYSDANFTMRLSYGQVGGYDLGGYDSGYYTDSKSIVEKMDKAAQNYEYEAEPIMRELMSATDYGKYTDKTTGKMHLCFLTNNDITGGNSGSPMFNGKGELIGLAFDGNWDSLSADIFFDTKLARCIGVDIRFVLYMMDKWGHADRLLDEIFRKN